MADAEEILKVKLFEIRDRLTFIPAIAVKLTYSDAAERFLLRRVGYEEAAIADSATPPYILLSKLDGGRAEYDPFAWGSRTMNEAHRYIQLNWQILESGAVIDVEYILGESRFPKLSERTENPQLGESTN